MNGRIIYFILNFIAAFSGFIFIVLLIEGTVSLFHLFMILFLFLIVGIKEIRTPANKTPEVLIVDERRKNNLIISVMVAFLCLVITIGFMLVQPWFGLGDKLMWSGILVAINLIWLGMFSLLERRARHEE